MTDATQSSRSLAAAAQAVTDPSVRLVLFFMSRNGCTKYERVFDPKDGHVLIGPGTKLDPGVPRMPEGVPLLQSVGGSFRYLKLHPGMRGHLLNRAGGEMNLRQFMPVSDSARLGCIESPIPMDDVTDVYIECGEYVFNLMFVEPMANLMASASSSPDLPYHQTDPDLSLQEGAYRAQLFLNDVKQQPEVILSAELPLTIRPEQNIKVPLGSIPRQFDLVALHRGKRVLRVYETWTVSVQTPDDRNTLDLNELRRLDRAHLYAAGLTLIPFPLGSSATVTIGTRSIKIKPL